MSQYRKKKFGVKYLVGKQFTSLFYTSIHIDLVLTK